MFQAGFTHQKEVVRVGRMAGGAAKGDSGVMDTDGFNLSFSLVLHV
jgi:hypothetical protein